MNKLLLSLLGAALLPALTQCTPMKKTLPASTPAMRK